MAFVGIEFNKESGGGVAIVHESWLTPRKQEVYWPPHKLSSKYMKALKSAEPPATSWTIYQVRRTFFHCDNYETAHKKLGLCENRSDVGTDLDVDAETLIPAKRARKRPRKIFDEEDDSDPSGAEKSQLVRPPRTTTDNNAAAVGGTPKATPRSVSTAIEELSDSSRDRQVFGTSTTAGHSIGNSSSCHDIDDAGCSSYLAVTPKSVKFAPCATPKDVGGTPEATPRSVFSIEETDSRGRFGQGFGTSTVTQERYLKLLLEIREQNRIILARLDAQDTNPRGQATLDLPVQLPISTFENILVLEEYLQEKKHVIELPAYLSTLGGRDVATKTNRILKNTISNALASQFSFLGTRGKRAFADLKLKISIIEAVKRDTPNSTTKQVEDAVKVWLKHAPKRHKSEAARQ